MMNGVIRSKKLGKRNGRCRSAAQENEDGNHRSSHTTKKVEDLSKALFLARKQHDPWVFVESVLQNLYDVSQYV